MVRPGSQVKTGWRFVKVSWSKGHRTQGRHTYNLTPECKRSSRARTTSRQWDSLSHSSIHSTPIPGHSPAPHQSCPKRRQPSPWAGRKRLQCLYASLGALTQAAFNNWCSLPWCLDLAWNIQLRMFIYPIQFIFQRINDCLIMFVLMISSYYVPLKCELAASMTAI